MKVLLKFFSIILLISLCSLGLFGVVVYQKRREHIFLVQQLNLSNERNFQAFVKEFGKPMYRAKMIDGKIMDLAPDLRRGFESAPQASKTAYVFPIHTVPSKFLLVTVDENGEVLWSNVIPM